MDITKFIDNKSTGYKLMQMRVSFDMSIVDIARLTGASRTSVYRWETGEALPSVYQLAVLAAYYKCRMDDLIVTYF